LRFPGYACSCRDILQQSMAGWDIVSVLWTIFQAGRQAGLYPQSSNSTLRQKPFKSLFDVWCGEFIKEDARQKASRFNSISYPAWGQNAPYANQSSESPDIHSLIDQQERVQVVGYSGHICEECLQINSNHRL
jgi:hypothetical protein